MPELLYWLENSTWATAIRQSLWMYPALEIIHILGIVLLVGGALLFDFRLLGFSKNLPLTGMSRFLLPWSQRGLILVIPSGLLLFITNAETLGLDPTFWLKMSLLIVAALNALLFHKFVYKGQIDPNITHSLSLRFKIPALISIAIWIAVITCGRLLAY
ncbi:DUF6644 family protein [Algoriphagus sp. D3-2-R+10]|uniref:DUF6644 family protein n=1 Tax=Algoriphagus aurantiacus TaxID=3103948 RepID=UPI002B3EB4E9|nr:DUF6644 family protein [Algoriphagus sp. D3-2-R+10]MEB2775065.1 DUF6644 family protein [Algoriphagus sp. D3-2-R+10]